MISICVHFPTDVMFTFSFGAKKNHPHSSCFMGSRVLMSMCIYIHTYSFISRLPILEKSCTSTLILFLRDHKECSNKHECACVSKVCWFKVPAYIPGHDIVLFLVCWQNSTVISTMAIQHTFHATVSLSAPSPPSSYLPQHTLPFASLMTVNLTEVRKSPGIVHFLYG